ncbi:MAG: hypothetical protein ABW166_04235 [Sedimenticola sp.]
MLVQNPNIEILELAASRLGNLVDDLVFLGGCATGLLITDAGASPIRMTRDVDVIAEVSTLSDYHGLAGHLREKGFKEDMSDDAPIYRWVADPFQDKGELAAIESRLTELEAEKQKLLKRQRELLHQQYVQGLVSQLSPEQKVSLFGDLFKGRRDVFATRWQNTKGRSGYSVACHNEWVLGVCNKRKIK